MSRFYQLLGVDSPFDPTHRFASSWLLSPWTFFAARAFMALYAFTTIFFILAYDGIRINSERAGSTFSFFTSLSYWGVAFYYLFASLHSFSYAKTGVPWLSRWPRPLQALHSLFYTTIVTYTFLVTIVFWAILASSSVFDTRFSTWSNLSQHALNSLYGLFELILARTNPMPWLHLLLIIILLALYVALAYLTFDTQGYYVYTFLDPTTHGRGLVAGYVFGILAAIIVIFLIVRGLIWLRRRITEGKNITREAKRSRQTDSSMSQPFANEKTDLEAGLH